MNGPRFLSRYRYLAFAFALALTTAALGTTTAAADVGIILDGRMCASQCWAWHRDYGCTEWHCCCVENGEFVGCTNGQC